MCHRASSLIDALFCPSTVLLQRCCAHTKTRSSLHVQICSQPSSCKSFVPTRKRQTLSMCNRASSLIEQTNAKPCINTQHMCRRPCISRMLTCLLRNNATPCSHPSLVCRRAPQPAPKYAQNPRLAARKRNRATAVEKFTYPVHTPYIPRNALYIKFTWVRVDAVTIC